jgi:hypothetical protein
MSEFHRIAVDQWQHVLGIISLMLFFFTFIFTLARTKSMPANKVAHLATLPLDEDSSNNE